MARIPASPNLHGGRILSKEQAMTLVAKSRGTVASQQIATPAAGGMRAATMHEVVTHWPNARYAYGEAMVACPYNRAAGWSRAQLVVAHLGALLARHHSV